MLKPIGQRVSEEAVKFVVAFGAPTLVLCLVVSLKSKLEINWPAPTHLMGLGAVAIIVRRMCGIAECSLQACRR